MQGLLSLCVFFGGKWVLEATLFWYLVYVYCVVIKNTPVNKGFYHFVFKKNTLDPPKNETPFNERGTKDDTFTQVVELLRENFCIFRCLGKTENTSKQNCFFN